MKNSASRNKQTQLEFSSPPPPPFSDYVIHKQGTFVSLVLALLFGVLSLRARRLASPAGSARKPEPRSGRPRARRLSLLLPVLALLLGAFLLSPFAAAPAAADVLVSNIGQTVVR